MRCTTGLTHLLRVLGHAKLRRRVLRVLRRRGCMKLVRGKTTESDRHPNPNPSPFLHGMETEGRLLYRTATKSTSICFHSMQKGLGLGLGWRSDLVFFPETDRCTTDRWQSDTVVYPRVVRMPVPRTGLCLCAHFSRLIHVGLSAKLHWKSSKQCHLSQCNSLLAPPVRTSRLRHCSWLLLLPPGMHHSTRRTRPRSLAWPPATSSFPKMSLRWQIWRCSNATTTPVSFY